MELFANNAESTIADVGGITSTATTITLASGEGARFPAAVTGTSQFRAVLVDASTNAVLEYITVTNRSSDTLTITRESEDATRFPKAARAQGVKVVDVITAAVLSLIGVPAGGTAGQVLGKSTSADYAQAWTTPGYGGGDYFRSGYYSLGLFTSEALSTIVMSVGSMYLRPFFVPVRRAFDRIALNVTAGGTAGAVLRMGLYASGSDGFPSTLIVDGGTVANTSAGSKAVTIAQTLDPGIVWIATAAQVASCTVTRFGQNTTMPWVSPNNSAPTVSSVAFAGVSEGSVTGAFPSTIPGGPDLYSGEFMMAAALRAT